MATTADFLGQIYATSLLPDIKSPTGVNPRSKTLIDYIFSADTNGEVTSGNILTSISDHLAQFLLFPLKSDSHLPKNNFFVCATESPLKMIKNAFYFILKALFVLKICKFLP